MRQRVLDENNYQGNAVVNYTEQEVPYTRIIEHKHFEFGNPGEDRYLQRVSGRHGRTGTNHIIRSMMRRIQRFMQNTKSWQRRKRT